MDIHYSIKIYPQDALTNVNSLSRFLKVARIKIKCNDLRAWYIYTYMPYMLLFMYMYYGPDIYDVRYNLQNKKNILEAAELTIPSTYFEMRNIRNQTYSVEDFWDFVASYEITLSQTNYFWILWSRQISIVATHSKKSVLRYFT
jgi:hypothetical protein